MWDWAAWQGIGTAISAAVAIWALVTARGSVRRADEATAASNRTAAAVERLAMTSEARAIERAQKAPVPRVAWRLEWLSGHAYLLHNEGTAPALDVRLESLGGAALPEHELGRVEAQAAKKFMTWVSLATRDDTITVHWTDEDGHEHTWDRPLPPKR